MITVVQNWMYTSVYFDAALVTRLYLTTPNSEADLKKRHSHENGLSIVNGILYVLFIGVTLMDFFVDGRLIETIASILLSICIAIVLGFSMRRLSQLLENT